MEHEGHRHRLRTRFFANGLDGFAEHEALEMLLTFAIPRMDTNAIAHRLIDCFGSLRAVLEADRLALSQVKGIGENASTLISMLLPLYRIYQLQLLDNKPIISNINDAIQLCRALLLGKQMETFFIISMNAANRVTYSEKIAEGTVNEVSVYPRNLLMSAINHRANGIILTHNHPGGDSTPSQEDIDVTIELSRMLQAIQITLFDHIIISDSNVFSFRAKGYFSANNSDNKEALANQRNERFIAPAEQKRAQPKGKAQKIKK